MNIRAQSVMFSETSVPNSNHGYKLYVGDCIESLRLMPDQSVNCCVTSPPYYGLRDYGVDGQIGLEETPEQFIARLVDVFREVHRVLRDDGVLWVNMGDSYYNYRPGKGQILPKQSVSNTKQDLPDVCARRGNKLEGLKEKDLIGIPWMLAFALRADGWHLRQDIIWNKPNPMPESVRDRCTKSHEYVFLLSKSPRYFFDNEAIKEPANLTGKGNSNGFRGGAYINNNTFDNSEGGNRTQVGNHAPVEQSPTKNKRSVWNIATRGYKAAHFATFPPELIEPCILAGSVVLDPFGGSGTTAGVAIKHGRDAVLCELNPEYAQLIPERIDSIVSPKQKKPRKMQAEAAPDDVDERTMDLFSREAL